MKRTHQFWAVNAVLLGMLAVFGLRAVQRPMGSTTLSAVTATFSSSGNATASFIWKSAARAAT